jgi:hypothetical protein
MKTITITIDISEETQQPLTVKSTIQEQINFHLKEKETAEKIKKQLNTAIKDLTEETLKELNNRVGADVWFRDRDSFNRIGFRDGIYKNTCYNDWDISISYTVKEVVFGELKYTVPILEKGIKTLLEPSERNFKAWRNKEDQKKYTITDLDTVHKYLEKDYITYFTNQIKP